MAFEIQQIWDKGYALHFSWFLISNSEVANASSKSVQLDNFTNPVNLPQTHGKLIPSVWDMGEIFVKFIGPSIPHSEDLNKPFLNISSYKGLLKTAIPF